MIIMISYHKLDTITYHNFSKVMTSYDERVAGFPNFSLFFFFCFLFCFSFLLKSTLVVDTDTTVHDVHTYIVAFQSLSPDLM